MPLKRLLIILYICLIGLLAAATFIEQAYGTEFVERNIYHTIWFCCLWGVIAAIGVVALIRRSLWRRLPVLLFHGSLLVILAVELYVGIHLTHNRLHSLLL